MRAFLKAMLWGVALLIVLNGAYLVAIQVELFSKLLLVISQISPLIAAAVAAYLAPRRRVIVGIAMAIPSVVLTVAVTVTYQLLGQPVDFPGLRGAWILIEITSLYSLFLCSLGGIIGSLLAIRREPTKIQV